jgi:hypothetical protein
MQELPLMDNYHSQLIQKSGNNKQAQQISTFHLIMLSKKLINTFPISKQLIYFSSQMEKQNIQMILLNNFQTLYRAKKQII